ncbi:MAG: hypothetical protein AAGG68_18380 [Bacteroidota bacterium]
MLINKSNYELFALDYIEGNLELRERKAMKDFLQAHPDLDAEIESMRAAMFTFEADESIIYDNKASLLREENETPVVFMQPRRWYQMAAAAAVAILLIGFGVGYFAGSLSSDGEVILVENEPKVEEKVVPVTPVEAEGSIAEVEVQLTDNELVNPVKESKSVDKKQKIQPLILQEEASSSLAIVEEEIVEEKTEPIETLLTQEENIFEEVERAEVVAVRPLPKLQINITINSIESPLESSILQIEDSKDLIARLSNTDRIGNKLSKIKSFLGKLPFEDATLDAFVPTYFANAD